MTAVELSADQRKLVLYHRLFPGDTSFTLAHVERLRGPVDADRLRWALETVLTDAVNLNVVFEPGPDGEVGRRHPGVPAVQVCDAPAAEDDEAEAAAVAALAGASADRPRPPGEWPLYEVVIHRGRRHTYLSMVFSHLISDAVTMFNIAEMAAFHYSGVPLSREYQAGLAYTAAPTVDAKTTERAVRAYRELLAGVDQLTHDQLAGGREDDGSLRGVVRHVWLPPDLNARLRNGDLVEKFGENTTFLAAYAVVLSRLVGRTDVVIGVPLATRRNWRQMHALGYFINTVPLTVDLARTPTFTDLCTEIADRISTMLRHKLVDLSASGAEIFEGRRVPSLQLDNALTYYRKEFPLQLPGCVTDTLFVPRAKVRYPLTVNVRAAGPGLSFGIEYAHRLAPADPAAMLIEVLDTVAADPSAAVDRVPVLSRERERALDRLVNRPRRQPVPQSLDAWFRSTAQAQPDRIAIDDDSGQWTYAELDGAVSRVAASIEAGGCGPHVAVAMRRRRELVAVLLGVLRAGRTYVPIDPAAPPERVRHILGQFPVVSLIADDDALPGAAVTARYSPAEVLAGDPAGPDVPGPSPEDVAYIIFTSGSTGVPKGVEVTHRNVMRLFRATEDDYGFDEQDVWCLFHSYAFDFSVWELFGALLYGGRLVVPGDAAVRDPQQFLVLLAESGVTVLNQTPSAFRRLCGVLTADTAARLRVRWVVFGGEALAPASLRPWAELVGRRARLVNMYGITETTVHTTFHEVDLDRLDEPESVIGRPLADLWLAVVDEHLRRCPPGVPGEILVGGDGLARGYLGREDLTAERFLTGTPYGDVVYRTGDRAYVRPDGALVYLNRIDSQVQIRGYRIELGEVESALRAVPGIRDVHVGVDTPEGEDVLLVAWIVDTAGHPSDVDVRAALVDRLPHYMTPAAFLRVPEMPLTVNGKVDTRALPPLSRGTSGPETGDETVDAVIRVWARVIGHDRIGPDDSLFDVGGTSMHVVRVHQQLGEALAVDGLALVELFEYPTPRLLAARLRSRGLISPGRDRPARRSPDRRHSTALGDRRRAVRAALSRPTLGRSAPIPAPQPGEGS